MERRKFLAGGLTAVCIGVVQVEIDPLKQTQATVIRLKNGLPASGDRHRIAIQIKSERDGEYYRLPELAKKLA